MEAPEECLYVIPVNIISILIYAKPRFSIFLNQLLSSV